jgi:dTDP-4-dehydrorhamnose 3,5-epimerase
MKLIKTNIPEVVEIEPQLRGDGRGFFMETYRTEWFTKDIQVPGPAPCFVQDNHSGSRQGTLRGLHYQIRQPQGKLLRVVAGVIYDVAVDLRRSSPTFGQWAGTILSAENHHEFWVPAGFAHGFYVVSEWVELLYKTTDYYAPEYERTLMWNDPDLAIPWPLVAGQPPLLSAKDTCGRPLREAEVYE